MRKSIRKYILPSAIFILLLIPIITSSLLDLEQRKINEENYRKFQAAEQAQREAEQKTYLMGKFDPSGNENFVLIPQIYRMVENQMYLRKESMDAFVAMADAAASEGILLKIASATRNFDYQKNIWNSKWIGATLVGGKDLSESVPDKEERFEKILEWSAVPGTSRHHWGTDVDLNNANPEYFETKEGRVVYAWLEKNAPLFGFCQPYNQKGEARSTGYNEEKWHWSYLPLARTFTQEYKNLIKTEDINGFLGAEYAPRLNLIDNYVLSINPECV